MAASLGTLGALVVGGRTYRLHRLDTLARDLPQVARLPYTWKILLENLLRHAEGREGEERDVLALATASPARPPALELAFRPARVLLQDFTGVPALVDLAAMREALGELGGDPDRIDPVVSADLVVDHALVVEHHGTSRALEANVAAELARNRERYALLRWAQQAFRGLRIVPPGNGICHQFHLERLAHVVVDADGLLVSDTVVGTDSHTPMIGGLGVLGWGVGGIEAEAAMLGQPLSLRLPPVVGVRLQGAPPPGVTATDLVLTLTALLRRRGVVGAFVEFHGPGLDALSAADRATLANMAPEYGATTGYFPIDEETLAYLRLTGRSPDQVARVEAYARAQGLFRSPDAPEPDYGESLVFELAAVEPSLAGPRRPQDRVPLAGVRSAFRADLLQGPEAVRSLGAREVTDGPVSYRIGHGAVVIAAITSCTSTSNPALMLGAGLLARRAVERGLRTRPWVKTSLAPGSRVVAGLLRDAGLLPYLEALGFHLVGYGCTTCIGNSGPLPAPVADALRDGAITAAAVISGNRNFEGRIHPQVRQCFLASPPLVVAYALAGTVDLDLDAEPVGFDPDGAPVHLRELWPSPDELRRAQVVVGPEAFRAVHERPDAIDPRWAALPTATGRTYRWEAGSTYVRRPPFLAQVPREPTPIRPLQGARVLALLGDSVTTDHLSPAGDIPADGPAGRWLVEQGVPIGELHSFGARRGNHEVMLRGTLAGGRLRNALAAGREGGFTVHLPDGAPGTIHEVALRYEAEGVPLIVIAGAEYGTGSSRDWAAKGTRLLGVRAVLARSFERIHRGNLVGVGVLPLELPAGEDAHSLGLDGRERYEVCDLEQGISPGQRVRVIARRDDGGEIRFDAVARLDTAHESELFRHGGLLPYVLRQRLRA